MGWRGRLGVIVGMQRASRGDSWVWRGRLGVIVGMERASRGESGGGEVV